MWIDKSVVVAKPRLPDRIEDNPTYDLEGALSGHHNQHEQKQKRPKGSKGKGGSAAGGGDEGGAAGEGGLGGASNSWSDRHGPKDLDGFTQFTTTTHNSGGTNGGGGEVGGNREGLVELRRMARAGLHRNVVIQGEAGSGKQVASRLLVFETLASRLGLEFPPPESHHRGQDRRTKGDGGGDGGDGGDGSDEDDEDDDVDEASEDEDEAKATEAKELLLSISEEETAKTLNGSGRDGGKKGRGKGRGRGRGRGKGKGGGKYSGDDSEDEPITIEPITMIELRKLASYLTLILPISVRTPVLTSTDPPMHRCI